MILKTALTAVYLLLVEILPEPFQTGSCWSEVANGLVEHKAGAVLLLILELLVTQIKQAIANGAKKHLSCSKGMLPRARETSSISHPCLYSRAASWTSLSFQGKGFPVGYD